MASRWLGPGNKTFLEMVSMVVTWWTVAFLCSVSNNVIREPLSRVPLLMLDKPLGGHDDIMNLEVHHNITPQELCNNWFYSAHENSIPVLHHNTQNVTV